MSTKMRGRAPDSAKDNHDPILAQLSQFQVIKNRTLQWITLALAPLLALALLIDWLVGTGYLVNDPLRFPAYLSAILELIVLNTLFGKAPTALRTLWERGLIGAPGADAATDTFAGYLGEFKRALNHRAAWTVAGVGGILALASTYGGQLLLSGRGVDFGSYSSSAFFVIGPIIQVPTGVVLGLLGWRFVVISLFIARLGRRLTLKILPNHPDHSGGLKPLGDLCFTNALVVFVPVFLLSLWIILSNQPGFEVYRLWYGLFSKGLVILSIGAGLFFVWPLYAIHLQMVRQRQEIQSNLDELSRKMAAVSMGLIVEADELPVDESERRMQSIKLMQTVYEDNSQVPVWPFDSSIIARFITAEAVPLISITGIGGKAVDLIATLLPVIQPPQ